MCDEGVQLTVAINLLRSMVKSIKICKCATGINVVGEEDHAIETYS